MKYPASGFHSEPLGRQHNKAAFSCGVEVLDRYLKQQAGQDARKRVAAPFVLLAADQRIAGYYTLCSASVAIEDLSPDLVHNLRLPRYRHLPTTLIGRLARDSAFRGQGIGELLLLDALRRSLESTSQIASMAVVVDAKDEHARSFYSDFGFASFPESRNRLFMGMQTVEDLFR